MTILEYRSTFVPVYYLRGARLPIFDLDTEQRGQCDAILLQRDGDCALLPTRIQCESLDQQPFARHIDPETEQLTLSDLQRDGWEVFGRITITKEKVTSDQ